MLCVRLSRSSFKVAIALSASEMALINRLLRLSNALVSPSALSNSFLQYSFLLSSSACCLSNCLTNLSIISASLLKLVFLPRIAKEIKSKRGSLCLSAPKTCLACRTTSLLDTCTCSSDVLGRAFLKRSKASSSFKILIVCASAKSSSERVLDRTSHSPFLVAQFLSKSARNAVFLPKPFFVSSKSSTMVTRFVLTSPRRTCFVSLACIRELISASFAAQSLS
mmetsp:Transcript_108465/g.280467  ORF Transcript_108465/g.280467 Transcript_108465/m.280467 type:complete len:223 (-) Transcript_108465:248-916(-)